MNRFSRRIALGQLGCCCALGLGVGGCNSVPITGRQRFLPGSEDKEIQLGLTAYQDTLSSETLSNNQYATELVKSVGERIAKVAKRKDYAWEFNLISSESQNAFALPGGKVAVFEGILPVCKNEAGLAVVMAHEVAHALARHGGERMTKEMGVNVGKQIASVVTQTKYPDKADLVAQYYGAASQYGFLLPFSRKHEAEADHIGIMLMAQAGYDPSAAPEFWQRFGSLKSDTTPEWLSTHPADDNRAQSLAALLGEARSHYQDAPSKVGMGRVIA